MPRASALLIVLGCTVACSTGCGDASTSSSLRVTQLADGGQEVSARWQYTSSSVDVDSLLVTAEGEAGCETRARLSVDKAVLGTEVYARELACEELELTEQGDLVLVAEATGHDWSTETLEVDTGSERITLGPWSASEAAPSYRFMLYARECGDCECPELRRYAGDEATVLALGRYCD